MAILETTISQGTVRGIPGANQAVSLFLGIPYAKAPVGELRWKAPLPAEKWEGVFHADHYGPIPTQTRFADGSYFQRESYPIELPASEDCLHINVFTPAKIANEKLPVALWIYGGAYRRGYANKLETDGEGFAKRGIVFVSFNYRLNVFGFLTHPEMKAESTTGSYGNFGTLDQIAALDWVRKNISAFGGDPENITVFGQSAGAMSCQILTCSDLCRGKIKRAIFESGAGIGGMNDLHETVEGSTCSAEQMGIRFFEELGVSSLAEARKKSETEVLEAYARMEQSITGVLFQPHPDGYILKENVSTATLNSHEHDIDYMIGNCSNESSTWIQKPYNPDTEKACGIIRKKYGNDANAIICELEADTPEGAAEYFASGMSNAMLSGTLAWCTHRADAGKKPFFTYLFTRNVPDHPFGGTPHSGEHMYVFQTLGRSWRHYNGEDWDLSNTVANYWANFIKTGDPNGDGLPAWQPWTNDAPNTMSLNSDCGMVHFPETALLIAERKHSIGK